MANASNEKVKRRYFKWLRGAKGYSEQTVVAVERAIHAFEESTAYKDLKTFCERQATGFKKWLDDRRHNGRPISTTTMYHQLRHVNAFFTWLATQQGYRSKIALDAVSYLSLDKRAVREALSVRPKVFPSREQVLELVASIEPRTDIDRRDRALVAFLLLTGVRYRALCSLSIECVDVNRLKVIQDPRLGVQTKGGKFIASKILPFDGGLVEIVVEWIGYLTDKLKYGPSAPLFPRTRVAQAEDGYSFEARDLEPVFWKGGNSIRKLLKTRSEAAGLPYFNPHAYRHAACRLGLRYAKTPEQLKALSQNFGHEQVLTTLRTYGELDDNRVEEVISQMQFGEEEPGDESMIPMSEIEALITRMKRKA